MVGSLCGKYVPLSIQARTAHDWLSAYHQADLSFVPHALPDDSKVFDARSSPIAPDPPVSVATRNCPLVANGSLAIVNAHRGGFGILHFVDHPCSRR